MIHPAKNPMPGGFSMENFAPSLDAEAGEALGEFLSHFEDPMCDECDSGISESELMDRLKEALDERDEARVAVESINEILIQTQATCHRYREALEHYTRHRYTCPMFNPSIADRKRGESCDCGAEVALEALNLPTRNR